MDKVSLSIADIQYLKIRKTVTHLQKGFKKENIPHIHMVQTQHDIKVVRMSGTEGDKRMLLSWMHWFTHNMSELLQLQKEAVSARLSICSAAALSACRATRLTNPSLVKFTRTGSPVEVGSLGERRNSERTESDKCTKWSSSNPSRTHHSRARDLGKEKTDSIALSRQKHVTNHITNHPLARDEVTYI